MDTRPMFGDTRQLIRVQARRVPVLRATIRTYSRLQTPVLMRILERLRMDGGKQGRRQDIRGQGIGTGDLAIKVYREVDRLQNVDEELVLCEQEERIDWYDVVNSKQSVDCDGMRTWRLIKME